MADTPPPSTAKPDDDSGSQVDRSHTLQVAHTGEDSTTLKRQDKITETGETDLARADQVADEVGAAKPPRSPLRPPATSEERPTTAPASRPAPAAPTTTRRAAPAADQDKASGPADPKLSPSSPVPAQPPSRGGLKTGSSTTGPAERDTPPPGNLLDRGIDAIGTRVRSVFDGGKAFWAKLRSPVVLANPLVWERVFLVVVVIVAAIALFMAFYLINCTAKGTCTGRDPNLSPTNGVSDRDSILTILAKEGDQNARAQLMLKNRAPIVDALTQQKATEKDSAKQAIIQKLIDAINALKLGYDYSKIQTVDLSQLDEHTKADFQARIREKQAALDAYAEYDKKVGSGFPLVTAYMSLATQHGGKLTIAPSAAAATVFSSWRSANANRKAGLHNGYDLYCAVGGAHCSSPVVVGWPGKIIGFEEWGGSYGWATTELYTDPTSGKNYIIHYGHMNYSQGSAQRGTFFIKHGDTGQTETPSEQAIASGKLQPQVKPGDSIGYIYSGMDHVDIKWQRQSDKRYVDWGSYPYKDSDGKD